MWTADRPIELGPLVARTFVVRALMGSIGSVVCAIRTWHRPWTQDGWLGPMPNRIHYPHEDQSDRTGYGSMIHRKGRTVITACGVVFSMSYEKDRFTTMPTRVTCLSCRNNAGIAPRNVQVGRRTKVSFLRVIDGAA